VKKLDTNMAIKIETIITDDAGNQVTFSQDYQEENTLLDKNVDEIEVLIMKAKKDMGKLAELELLRLNQSDYTKKKKH
jgi:hypothetical protein